jgi:hypothetical protein
MIVTVAGAALVMGTALGVLLPSDAARFESVSAVDVLEVVDAICSVRVARTPLPIGVLLSPATRQRMSPDAILLQVAVLPVELAAEPVA